MVGVRDAFYSKTKRFCSVSCSRSYSSNSKKASILARLQVFPEIFDNFFCLGMYSLLTHSKVVITPIEFDGLPPSRTFTCISYIRPTDRVVVLHKLPTVDSDGMRCVTDDGRHVWRMGLC